MDIHACIQYIHTCILNVHTHCDFGCIVECVDPFHKILLIISLQKVFSHSCIDDCTQTERTSLTPFPII